MIARALVSGMSGFLGRQLSALLVARGAAVHGLHARFHPETAEVLPIETAVLAETLRHLQPDYLFHLAGISKGAHAEDFFRVNTLYAAVLVDALMEAGLAQTTLVLVGSAAEYGPLPESDLPAREDGPTQPADLYGASKLAQTCLGLAAARRGQRVVIVRPSNIIGPGMPGHLAIPSFVRQLAAIARGSQEPVLETGDLSASRDFIDVRDAAKLIIRAAEVCSPSGRVVNVCRGRAFPIEDIVRLLLDLFARAGHGPVRTRQGEIASTATSSSVHFSSNGRMLDLLGSVEYIPLTDSLSVILDAELGHV